MVLVVKMVIDAGVRVWCLIEELVIDVGVRLWC